LPESAGEKQVATKKTQNLTVRMPVAEYGYL